MSSYTLALKVSQSSALIALLAVMKPKWLNIKGRLENISMSYSKQVFKSRTQVFFQSVLLNELSPTSTNITSSTIT